MGRVCALVLVFLASAVVAQPVSRAKAEAVVRGLPVPFVESRGRYGPAVRFHVEAGGRTVLFTAGGVTFRLAGEPAWTVRFSFVDGADVTPEGEAQAETVVSYFRGGDDSQTGLRTYERVVYREVWPGIDVVYALENGRLKYDVIVHPGADPAQARFRYEGAERVERTDAGGLRVVTPAGEIEEGPPVVFQPACDGGARVPVEATLDLIETPAGCEIAFTLGDYDRTRPLVIDPPVLVYCGYLFGLANIEDIAVGPDGALYLTGYTNLDETKIPVTVGPDLTFNSFRPPPNLAPNPDAFVARIGPDGTGVVYLGYIGGLGSDVGHGVAVDAAGAAYVVGATDSLESNFPVAVGPDLTQNDIGAPLQTGDGFIAKVRPDGTGLVYCGYLGGALGDRLIDVAVDVAGVAFVVGNTESDDGTFPVKVGPFLRDPSPGGYVDGFVARVASDGKRLDYCSYLGGSKRDWTVGVTVGGDGAAYVVGGTLSTENDGFPVAVGPDLTYNSPNFPDSFIAKVKPDASGLDYCGYIGGRFGATVSAVAVDRLGRAYLCGGTLSDEHTFPVRVGPDLTHSNDGEGFVGRLRADGSGWEYLGYLGGVGPDNAVGIAVDAIGRATVAGGTASQDFPAIGPAVTPNNGGGDAYIARVDPTGAALEYSTFVGSPLADGATHVATDPLGNRIYIVGGTMATEAQFPVRVGPDLTFNGWGRQDTFAAKVALTELTVTGTPRPGATMTLVINDEPGLPYQLGSSLGTGPIPIGARPLGLSPDPLLALSVSGTLPGTFVGYTGTLDAQGLGQASLRIPNVPALAGVVVHSAFVTFKPSAPLGIQSVSNTESFWIY